MDALTLCYRDEPLRDFVLGSSPLEVGRGPGCDIVVHDATVAERELLVERRGAEVRVWDLTGGEGRRRSRPLPVGDAVRLGSNHSIVRVADVPTRPRRAPGLAETQPVTQPGAATGPLVMLIGHGSDARRVAFGEWPVRVGSAQDNDVVLTDRTVSARHCRIAPMGGDLLVRDLGSRNGTWVDGVRVLQARVGAGAHVRLGRTDLRVVARGSHGDARSTGLVAASNAMLEVLGDVERLARLSWPVLVTGESGSGKEGVARALHTRGPRADGPFVAINAGGLPRDLVEAELFGHERGAFTGASGSRKGVFEQADGGTLFLDEIGELPLDVQARLLRVLESWRVRRIGSESPVPVDVRLVCATHRDLRRMVASGTFRRDLYYRVARLALDVPPLRERPEDVCALADHFLRQARAEVGERSLSTDAVGRLLAHAWPGNARELRNVVCAAAAATPARRVEAVDVERAIVRLGGEAAAAVTGPRLHAIVEAHRGNMSAAARTLGIPRSTLRDRLKGLSSVRPEGSDERLQRLSPDCA